MVKSMPTAKQIGKITHYYDKIGVAIIELLQELKAGDMIKIVNRDGSEFTQAVSSIQLEHQPIEKANKGQSVGVKVDQKVKENDLVYAV